MTYFFGAKASLNVKVHAMRLKLNGPRIITHYTGTLHKFYVKHNLYWKVSQLNTMPITYTVEQLVAKQCQAIDTLRVQGIKHAEKTYRKLHVGKMPWSPEVSKVQLTIELWSLVNRRIRNC